jgi:SAM-dependent methyltransferase
MDDEAYWDAFAAYYDAAYGEDATPIPDDREFYRERARAADGPVLEVGCGTGRIYLELLRDGVDAYGIDLSTGMLDRLREKAAAEGLDPAVRRADVTAFEPEREYALVIVPFRAFLHLTSLDDQIAALRNVRDALAPDGELALNIFAPNFEVICETYGESETVEVERDGDRYRIERTTAFVDEVEQIAELRIEVYDDADDLLVDRSASLKLVSKREFELLCRVAGFSEWTVSGGFEGDPLTSTDQEMVWVVEP